MARTKGTVKTPANIEPEVGLPLDARDKVATKADLTANGSFPYAWIGMKTYVAEEDKEYQLKALPPTELSNWEAIPNATELGETIDAVNDIKSMIVAHDSIINYTLQLANRINQLEKLSSDSIPTDLEYQNLTFASNVLKQDILPIHEVAKFCREFDLRYSADFTGTELPEAIKINNKALNFTQPVGSNSPDPDVKVIDVKATYDNSSNMISIAVFADSVLVESIPLEPTEDSFILTVEVETNGATPTFVSMHAYMMKMQYKDVALNYPYPVLELRDGTVIYRENLTGVAGAVAAGMPNTLGGMFDLKACYQIGNTATTMNNTFVVHHNMQYDSPYQGVEYVYMANWLWLSDCTSLSWCFTTVSFDSALTLYKSTITQLDFSKIRFKKLTNMGYGNVFYGTNSDYIADDIVKVIGEEHEGTYSGNWQVSYPTKYVSTSFAEFPFNKLVAKNATFGFKFSDNITSLGDLSNWQLKDVGISGMFSGLWLLEDVGNLSKWDFSNANTKLGNLFKGCFYLHDIGYMGNWDTSKVDAMGWTFESCNQIGDGDFDGLENWDTSNCNNFRGPFSYLYEDATFNAQTGRAARFFRELGITYPPPIIKKRTNLSFVDNWDMSKAEKLEAFFANNPYLTNVGDLRKWNLASATITTHNKSSGFGMFNFLLNCSALENLKMPSIPRGTDVDDFVKGCTSLANIELNALNVEAISFEDCPLTKQSVLNLINAATADVDITLKQTVYDAYASDSDVTAAIAAKSGSSITVQLIRAE